MINKKKICCIITARKGSAGFPGKNLKKINNRPLIFFPISAAKKSRYIQDVYFNSDCEKMIKIALKSGAICNFKRPKKLANATAKSSDVLIHQIKKDKLHQKYEYILLLEPTSPLTETKDIDNAIKKIFLNKKATSLISVSDFTLPNSELSFKSNSKKKFLIPINPKSFYLKRRQDFKKKLFIDGSLYITKINSFLNYKSFIQPNTTYIKLKNFKMFQIDRELDFDIVDFLYKKFIN